MKKLAACDFEDILQCSIPPFNGLLEEPHNTRLMKLLYQTAEWHGYAKLCMHTNLTLTHMEALMKEFGQLMCEFRDITCKEFQTFELPKEANTRSHKGKKKMATATPAAMAANSPLPGPTTMEIPASTTRRPKKLNLSTYKFHAIGDYTIRTYKQACVRQIEKARLAAERRKHNATLDSAPLATSPESTTNDMDKHYFIVCSRNRPVYLYSVLRDHANDPAYAVSTPASDTTLFLTVVPYRASFQNYRTTFWADYYIESLMGTLMTISVMTTETLLGSWATGYTAHRPAE
ncbi:hypothetical protein DXG01_010982 [Tephrocybe rancida]|nr:hypothetical protein DXG01_010982 [Tephrocybe rancida]